MLLENPNPGRTFAASAFFGELGLSGDISRSLCWVVSSAAIILYLVS